MSAEPFLREALETGELAFAPGLQALTYPLIGLGLCLTVRGEVQEGERLLVRALELRRQRYGEPSSRVAGAQSHLAENLIAQGRYFEAEALLLSARNLLTEAGDTKDQARTERRLRALYQVWQPEREQDDSQPDAQAAAEQPP